MKLSFVIPAFNEAAFIETCLQRMAAAVEVCGRAAVFDVEYVVVDNNSSDNTAELAANAGATVVFEPINQISRARNAGAAAASGDWLVFVDADSEVSPELLNDVLQLIEGGQHIGCGSLMYMEVPKRRMRWMLSLWSWLSKTLSWAAGSFVVCRADVFKAVGGFSDELFVAEEIDFSQRVKKYARQHNSKFTVLCEHPLHTSNRKMALYTEKELALQTLRLIFRPRKAMRDKSALDVWYDGRR
jgi:glycosyltransferase involved in cell wall biosynthesis